MDEALEAAQRHVEAFNAHDVAAHAAIETPTIEWVQPGGVTLRGPDQVAENQRLLWEAFPDARVEVLNRVVAGSTVTTEAVMHGTHTGTFHTPGGDIPASGAAVRLRYASIQTVDGGRIASEHLYFDLLELLTQLGAAPAPPGPAA